MHEMSITAGMLDIVKEQMEKNCVSRLRRLKIRVGRLTAVEPESLQFCFEISVRGTALEGAMLEIEEVPIMGRCRECGKEFEIEGYSFVCTVCDGVSVEMISGRELDIVSMEAE